ncbi:MAG: hypothetical protein JF610_04050 [Acidobacteria bacterium]|nr:hypothetical protein [Acidobacteriota bacterium]
MRKQIALACAAAVLTTIAAAAQTAQQQPAQQGNAPNANQNVTVTGCVAAGPNNTFTLTAASDTAAKEAPTGTTATTPAGDKVAKTITYTLTTTGTSGGAKPTVETTAQTQIVVRQLNVNAVKMVSSSCSLVK